MSKNEMVVYQQLEKIATECCLAKLESYGRFERAFRLAAGIGQLRSSIGESEMAPVMQLQGSALGFRTDKDREGGYPPAVVKECLIEAVLRGLNPVGNEWNIISGRCYVTKEGLTRLLREWPGLTDLALDFGVPKNLNGGAIVECSATWKLGDRPCHLKREIPVKVNSSMGSDAILGKASRKLMAAVYQQVSGSSLSDGEADDEARAAAARPVDGKTADINAAIKASDGSVACPKCRSIHKAPVPAECLACKTSLEVQG